VDKNTSDNSIFEPVKNNLFKYRNILQSSDEDDNDVDQLNCNKVGVCF